MAILGNLPGIQVTISVNGEDLHEYIDPDKKDEPRAVTKYIEAVTGAKFGFKITVPKGFEYLGDCLVMYYYIDGKFVSAIIVPAPNTESHTFVSTMDSLIASDGTSRKLKFNELVLNEGPELPGESVRARDLGVLQVWIYHEIKKNKSSRKYTSRELLASTDSISEKATKGQAVSHSVGCDTEATRTYEYNCWSTEHVASDASPAGIFTFAYRSKASLKKLLIIPRTPSPVPLRERPMEQLTLEDRAELIKQLLAGEAESALMKRKFKEENEDTHINNRALKRNKTSHRSNAPVYLELDDDDDTFVEKSPIIAVERQHAEDETVITLD